MPTNRNWYDLAGARYYPFDDAATRLDDSAKSIPGGILVDAAIAMPRALGVAVYISGFHVGPRIVSVLLAATSQYAAESSLANLDDDVIYTPIGHVTATKASLTANRPIPIVASENGVGGWLVFGDGVEQLFSGKFSSHTQSQLLLRCVRVYAPLPVQTLGVVFNKFALSETATKLVGDVPIVLPVASMVDAGPALTGIVKFRAAGDLALRYEQRTGPYVPADSHFGHADADDRPTVQTIVFSLAKRTDQSVLAMYAGDCNARPESRNCPLPPVEKINGVSPDCDGDIRIRFSGVAVDPLPSGLGGQFIISDRVTSDACPSEPAPDEHGNVDIGESDCPAVVAAGPLFFRGQSTESLGFTPPMDAEDDPEFIISAAAPVSLFSVAVDFANGLPEEWRVDFGSFQLCENADSRSDWIIRSADPSRRNVAVWLPEESPPKQFQVYAEFQLRPSANRCGGVVLFYDQSNVRPRYLCAWLNQEKDALEVVAYNGATFTKPLLSVSPVGFYPNAFYWLRVICEMAGATCRLTAQSGLLGDSRTRAEIGPAAFSVKIDGGFGVVAPNSIVDFCTFAAEPI